MKRLMVMCSVFLFGCGVKDLNRQEGLAADEKTSSSYIECTASKYQNSLWSELGTFRSSPEPYSNNGELLQNAEFTSNDGVRFSAAGNFDEGLIYFGSIYDTNHLVGAEMQWARQSSIELYLLRGEFGNALRYSLRCEMKR